MADKSYNVDVGQKNVYNIYNDVGSSLTGLVPFQVGIFNSYPNNLYLFKSAEINRLATIFNPNLFNTPYSDIINILNPLNLSFQTFLFDGTKWVYGYDFITDANNYIIPENYLILLQTDNITSVPVGGGAVIKRHDCYYLNGTQGSGLYFEKGKSYQFIQTGTSNSGNPLNIYLDEYGNKKLEKYVSISGTAGLDRYVTVSIPKTYKETNTLYYGNESGEFFGAPIKLTSNEYYLKHNIKLFCFGAYHDGTKYYLPENLLDGKFFPTGNSYALLTTGIYGIISTPGNTTSFSSNLMRRKDTLYINLIKSTGGGGALIDSNFILNYFGNELRYTKNPIYSNDWSNLHTLYYLIGNLSFQDSGTLDNFDPTLKTYYQYGYQLSGCESCIEKINLTTGEGNIYSGILEIYYNPLKIINNNFSNPFLNITIGDIKTGDFISFDRASNIKYEKSFYTDTSYNIPRKI